MKFLSLISATLKWKYSTEPYKTFPAYSMPKDSSRGSLTLHEHSYKRTPLKKQQQWELYPQTGEPKVSGQRVLHHLRLQLSPSTTPRSGTKVRLIGKSIKHRNSKHIFVQKDCLHWACLFSYTILFPQIFTADSCYTYVISENKKY